ncbi:hypothetical protein PGRAN_09201 [Listeria grandensis FSL F6-0971]|uniref:Uncharacterized protein n=1 Tax=Listeria grandensis FSL F6-0971 TaxID=1265819 RepID=W7BBD8_9LIST|nr:hypothetical protein [Listeria grandensis]EUJ23337.1 hypothetical protein PGRAN_09201 [Listeria grandensis FSL F6-0971]MBC6315654.1 hypothetical protein [Listeria grandensis]
MIRYEKILVGIYSPDLDSYADQGDILFLPQQGDSAKKFFRPRRGTSYFVALHDNRKPSAIGVVKRIKGGITAEDLARLDCNTSGKKRSIPDNLDMYEKYLERVSRFPENQAMALYWQDRFGSKEKTLVVNKAILRGYDNLNLEELLQFDSRMCMKDYLEKQNTNLKED